VTRAELAEAAGADGARSGGYRMTQQILKVFQKKRNSRFYCFAHLKSKGNKIVFVSIKCITTSNIKTMYEFFESNICPHSGLTSLKNTFDIEF
jgi:hypothetical protein